VKTQEAATLETRPFLVMPKGASVWRAGVVGDVVRVTPGTAVGVPLDGQEFLRFRAVRDEETASTFLRDYGLLGLAGAVSNRLDDKADWYRALTLPTDGDYKSQSLWQREPLADWIRQAGLINLACGLLGLLKAEKSDGGVLRRQLNTRARRWSGSGDPAEQIRLAEGARWPVVAILEGAARAGLVLHHDPVQDWGEPSVWYLAFVEDSWRKAQGRTTPLSFAIAPPDQGRLGIAGALGQLLDPWTRRVQAALIPGDGRLSAGVTMPGELLSLFWLELADAALTEVGPRPCAWERCPGPPERPGVFLWRWSDSPTKGAKHSDSIYCHPRCKNAAQQAKRRNQ
jgi:hypothetical protein